MRYGFRQCFYGQTAAAAIGPIVVKTFGKDKKAAYLTPDYTYGHTVTKSMQDYLATAGWTTATDQVAPLGAPDYSSYLLNVANSGADVLLNVNWGHDAVLSTQQAKQFGIFDKMKLVVPYQTPFLAREVGGDLMSGVYAATDFWWTLEDKYPLAKMFVEAFEKKYGYKPEWGANNAYMEFALWAEAVENAGSFYPPDVIKSYEAGRKIQSTVGEVYFRKEDHQLVRPVIIVKGKAPKDMKNKEDYLRHRRDRPRRGADAEAGRVRLQSRRLYLNVAWTLAPWADFTARGACFLRRCAASGARSDHQVERLPVMINWPNFISQVFNGLALGALLALISSGLTIIYGTLGVLNLAHGAMFMLGGYAGYVAYEYTGSFVVAVIAGSLFVMVLGVVMERDHHPSLLSPSARGPAAGHLRARHLLRRDRAAFLLAASRNWCRRRRCFRASPRSASCSIRPTAWRSSASSRSRSARCSSFSTGRGSA